MSCSRNDRSTSQEKVISERHHTPINKAKNSLFSEIMKNHNSPNSPALSRSSSEIRNGIKSLPFDVNDVPLPEDSNQRHLSKLRNSRKRSQEECVNMESKKSRQSDPSKPKPLLPQFIMPKLCKRRTNICKGSTWGERSVKAFKILSEVGEGTYGHVFKAIDRLTNTIKALKKVRLENEREGFPITTVREIKILQQLNHTNIVRLHEVVTDYDLNDAMQKDKHNCDKGFYLVFEYMDHDLYGVLDSGINLSEMQVASISKQILEGINYSHKKMFLHRDIKCSNILINNKGEVKIADYGLSRRFYADNVKRPYTNKVITLWYRAPELLLGEECYGTSIDMWSIGCILGELFTHRTMFMANAEMEQLDAISRVCGSPSPATWPDVAKLPLYQSYRPKYPNKRRLREYYCTVPNDALDVLDWMLQLDPKRRCSAEQALRSYWLKNVDVRKVPIPQFPTDGDYHELSCKRRHKQTRADDSRRSAVPGRKSCSSDEVASSGRARSVAGERRAPAQQSEAPFELPDNLLGLLNDQLHTIMPNADVIQQLLQASALSEGDDIKERLEKILEPYITRMLTAPRAPLAPSVQSVDSAGSDVLGSGQSTMSGSGDQDDRRK